MFQASDPTFFILLPPPPLSFEAPSSEPLPPLPLLPSEPPSDKPPPSQPRLSFKMFQSYRALIFINQFL